MNKTCNYCFKDFKPKRKNQTFCSIKCRTNFHNGVAQDFRLKTKTYSNGLLNNRRILETLYRKNKSDGVYTADYLKGAGYIFSLLTHTLKDRDNNLINFCYEYGLSVQNNQYKILYHVHKFN